MYIQRWLPLLVMGFLVVGQARALGIDPGWIESNHFERNRRIPAGTAIEICGEVPLGTEVTWKFKTSAPVAFNVHFHEGKTFLEYPVKKSVVMENSSSLIVKASFPYCWQWGNRTSNPIELAVSFAHK